MVSKTFHDQETATVAGNKTAQVAEDEAIVISGLSGMYPDADDVTDFAQKLYDKVDMITQDSRRWQMEHPEIPQRTGKLNIIDKLDASYFGMHFNQSNTMDPMCRILLEKSYEAIIDSGTNPNEIKGTNTGVFVGACFSESEKTWFFEKLQASGFAVTGCIRSMMANRLSYWLGVDGPSSSLDTACSSSMYAFEYAYKSLREGLCDAAIVGGCNLCLHPYVSLQFSRLGVLSMDGRCKTFDESANGYCRSEAICAVYLQKKKDARRIYATVIHAKANCDGYKEQGITYPSGEIQQQLLKDFYQECEIRPTSLAWVEAHGTGTKVGDPEEVKALVKTFCTGREAPLKIGSVKSNIGHTEPVSGLCSITKVITAMETGLIPPNINLKKLRSDIKAFHDGTIEVMTDSTPWEGGMVGLNSFGFGGANCHVLLNWNEKGKINKGLPDDDIPRLVNISGRTEAAVDFILKKLEIDHLDREYCKLYHEIHKMNIPSHVVRGFTILHKNNALNAQNKLRMVKDCRDEKPLYFMFPGTYTSWKTTDDTLRNFPVYTEAMNELSKILSLDVFDLVSNPKKEVFKHLINNFIGITATQIALVDLLKSIDLTPDKYVGTSIGEIACAYADGCISAREAILVSYYTAASILESDISNCLMGILHLPYNVAKSKAPNGIDVFPIDKKYSFVFGSSMLMNEFVKKCKKENIESGELATFGNPLNTSYVAKASNLIKENLKKVLTHEKVISNKWLTTISQRTCNADYFWKAFTGPLNSEAITANIPEDAIVLEIGPEGIHHLSAITKTMHVFNKSGSSNCLALLLTLGRLYTEGVNMNLSKLYPKVEYPVSRSTPMISPMIKWDHSEDWYVTSYSTQGKIKVGEMIISISLDEDDSEYISGHVIDGRNLFPATGYLAMVWQTIGSLRGELYTEMPIIFENVRFHRATNLSKDGCIDFTVIVSKSSGNFEVMEGGAGIVTGRVFVPQDMSEYMSSLSSDKEVSEYPMNSKDFYKELRLRGYNYKGLFRSITKANVHEKAGKIHWQNNWVAFMDNMLQLQIILEDTRGLYVPTSIEYVLIDPKKHTEYVKSFQDDKHIPVVMYKENQIIKSGLIEVRGLKANAIARRKNLGDPVYEQNTFIPNECSLEHYDLDQLLRIMVQIVLENEPTVVVKAVEVASSKRLISPIIFQVLADLPLINPDLIVLTNPNVSIAEEIPTEITVEDKKLSADQNALIAVTNGILLKENVADLESCLSAITERGFIITREAVHTGLELVPDSLTLVASYVFEKEKIMLLKKKKAVKSSKNEIIRVSRDNLEWIPRAQKAMINDAIANVYFVAEHDRLNGVMGLVNCLRKEPPNGLKAKCVLIFDNDAPAFSLDNPFYSDQLAKNLSFNVYKNGQWGTYRHLLLKNHNLVKTEYAYVNNTVRGDLSSLDWFQGNYAQLVECGDKGGLVKVYYTALNFRDIMLVTGKLAPEVAASGRLELDCVIGFEFSGIRHGKRYMGMVRQRGLATIVQPNKYLTWEVPAAWTLEEAVTVPVVYGTTVYGMIVNGRMRKGDTVLIHAGSGGVGQAALHLAFHYGCTVFTTVGTMEKRNFLLKTFPQLLEKNIGNSRDTSFEQLVMKETNGRGVDIVLNSLAEEKLLASVRCLAKCGRFIEIGKFDLSNNNPIGMELFKRGASFYGVMLDNVFDDSENVRGKWISEIFQSLIESGAIKPLCRTVFPSNQLESAFRFMASGKHIGKVCIKVSKTDETAEIPESIPNELYECTPRFFCHPEGSYIVIGGLGGFGLELADWMILRGAKHVVLTSRRGRSNGYQDVRINLWKSYGVNVTVSTEDVTKPEGVVRLLKDAASLAPVKGIFNLAVVLKDGIFENQTIDSFKVSLEPKAQATIYLDQYSREMCPQLETFVVFSSVSCGRGNAGQTNYGFSNSVMERVCEIRTADGLPGCAIQWGAIGDVGLVAEMQDEQIEIVIGGTLQQRITSCLEVLDQFLTHPKAVMSSMVVAEKRAGGSSSDNIVDTVVNILGLRDLKTVSLHSTLAELGMDSMMAVEIKQTLEREFEVFLSPQDIRGMTFAKLHELASTCEADPETSSSTIMKPTKENFKMDFLINHIGDEPEVFEPIVKCRYSANESVNNQVFIAPGIEGFYDLLEPLGKSLSGNVFCLNFDVQGGVNDTIENLTGSLLPHVIKQLGNANTFNLVGYSFGGLVVLAMALELENRGMTGKICLVDSSPFLVKAISEWFRDGDDESIQIKVLLRYLDVFHPQETSKIETKLRELLDWEAKVDYMSELFRPYISHSVEYQKHVMTAVYKRLKAIQVMKNLPENSIRSPVILIRPYEVSLPGEEDYGLSKYFKNEVVVHFVEGNHVTILKNPRTATLLNTFMNFEEDELVTKVPLSNITSEIIITKDFVKNM